MTTIIVLSTLVALGGALRAFNRNQPGKFRNRGLIGLGKSSEGAYLCFSNVASGIHAGHITKDAEVVISTRYLMGKLGTAVNQVDICTAADEPLGVITDEAAAAGDPVNVALFGSAESTQLMVASEAITAGAKVYTAAGGKVQNEPALAGTYYQVGKALEAGIADGDVIEVDAQEPIRVVVIAALGNTDNEIGALTFSGTPTQAEAEALRDKCEELADDVRNIAGALAQPSLVKVL